MNKLISVTTEGSPNVTSKNTGLLKRVQDSFHETYPNWEMFFTAFSSVGTMQKF
jgi:hypothetical protein